jgi:hypothetical protein
MPLQESTGRDDYIRVRCTAEQKQQALELSRMLDMTLTDVVLKLLHQQYIQAKLDRASGIRPSIRASVNHDYMMAAAQLAGSVFDEMGLSGVKPEFNSRLAAKVTKME